MTATKPQQSAPARVGNQGTQPGAGRGRTKLTDAEREKRKAELAAEPATVKFRRLARKRLTRAIVAIKGLEPLGRGAAYEYTTEQANTILQHLTDAVAAVKIAFAPKVRASKAAQELIDL